MPEMPKNVLLCLHDVLFLTDSILRWFSVEQHKQSCHHCDLHWEHCPPWTSTGLKSFSLFHPRLKTDGCFRSYHCGSGLKAIFVCVCLTIFMARSLNVEIVSLL